MIASGEGGDGGSSISLEKWEGTRRIEVCGGVRSG
jgi:hypothetical protein